MPVDYNTLTKWKEQYAGDVIEQRKKDVAQSLQNAKIAEANRIRDIEAQNAQDAEATVEGLGSKVGGSVGLQKATRNTADMSRRGQAQNSYADLLRSLNQYQTEGNYSTLQQMDAARQRDLENAEKSNEENKPFTFGTGVKTALDIGTSIAPYLIMSSRKFKKNIRPANLKKQAQKLKNLKISEYEYKDGVGSEGEKVGAVIEDNPEISKNGQALDMEDLSQLVFRIGAAVQELQNKEA